MDWSAVNAGLLSGHIHRHATNLMDQRGFTLLNPVIAAQNGIDARLYLFEGKGLGDVVVCAQLEAFDHVIGGAECG